MVARLRPHFPHQILNYIITGATSAIGSALLQTLEADKTAKVIATGFSKPVVTSRDDWVKLDDLDLCSDGALSRLRDTVESTFHSPFVVIHSVGLFWEHQPLHDVSLEFARDMILSHYLSLYGVARYLLPVGAQVGAARLIAFSCNSVSYNYPEMAAFTSSKAAVECLIKCIANEWSEYGVVANVLALPTIGTDAVRELEQSGKKVGALDGYISTGELAKTVLESIANLPREVNGNVIKVFKHSEAFFGKSYFDRNPSERRGRYLQFDPQIGITSS